MKVLLLTDSDAFAGTERHMLDLAVGLVELEVEVRLGCPDKTPLSRRAISNQIVHLPVAKRGTIDWRAARFLASELRLQRIDLIHAHNGCATMTAALAIQFAGRGHLVTTQHFLQPARTSRSGIIAWVANVMHGWVAKRLSHTIAISEGVLKQALQRGDCPANRVTVVPNGTRAVQASELPSRNDMRSSLGLNAEQHVIFCAARHQVEKDIPTLIQAMSIVVKTYPDACCLIAGEGKLTGQLQQLIDEAGLEKSVRLLGFRDDVPALIQSADIFALPSLDEPFGLVLIEAMALSKPIVAVALGGPLEIVKNGESGYLVESSNPEMFSKYIIKLLDDPARAQNMGDAGYLRFMENYTIARMSEQMLHVYQSVVEGGEPIASSTSSEEAEPVDA